MTIDRYRTGKRNLNNKVIKTIKEINNKGNIFNWSNL